MAIDVGMRTKLSTDALERYQSPAHAGRSCRYPIVQQSFPAPVRYDMLEIRVLHRRTKAEIQWHSSQFCTYPTRQPAATRCSQHSRPLAVKLWALTALHKQSHFYSSCTQLLSSCSITGPENGPVLTWCEAYGRFGQVFRSSCCAVNRSARCHQAWMPAEFICRM